MSSSDPVVSDADTDGLPLHQYLTYRMSRVHSKLSAQGARILRDAVGITLTQWRVIALVGAAGETRLSDLAREAALDKGLLSRNVKSLVARGLINAKQDDTDHRVQHLSLTPDGQEIFFQALPVTRRRQEWLRTDLTNEEIRVFKRVLDKLELAAERVDFSS